MSEQEFQGIEAKQRLSKVFQDMEDLNNERSGNNVGRIGRFGLDHIGRDYVAQQKKEFQSLLEHLMMSVAYREAYERAMATLGEVEDDVYEALIEASDNLSQSNARLTQALDRAQELADGTKIFRTKDGSVVREDRTQLPDHIAKAIDWREDAITFEEYQALRHSRDRDQKRYDQLSGYDRELSEIRGRMENKSNPPTPEELDNMQHRMLEIQREATKSNKAEAGFEANIPHQDETPNLNLDSLKM